MSEDKELRWYSDEDGLLVLASSSDEARRSFAEYNGEGGEGAEVEIASRIWLDLEDGRIPNHRRGEVLEGEL